MDPLRLGHYRRVVVLTGAGVSVASGLRPYRGPGGLWTEDPSRHDDASLAAATRDPMSPWRAFGSLREAVSAALPNPAHHALARAEADMGADASFTLVTQNVDGLHQAAGSRRVFELHGNLRRTRCSACDLTPFEDPASHASVPPCPACGAPLRPDVVLFDEPPDARAEWEAKRALRDCDLFLAIGTSGTVSPASNFVRAAEYAGARTIYVNLEPLDPPHPAFRETVLGRAEDVLPRLLSHRPSSRNALE